MAKYQIKSPTGETFEITAPDNASQDEVLSYAQSQFKSAEKAMPQGGFKSQTANELADIGVGALGEVAKFAGRILPGVTGEEAQAWAEKKLTPKNYQLSPEARNVGRTMTDVGAGFVAGPVLGAAGKLVGAGKYAQALRTGGMDLGQAATGSKLANALTRAGAGAAGGAITGALINPDETMTGAAIGAATPAIPALGQALSGKARDLMFSAIKPTTADVESGAAKQAIETMLEQGVNPTMQRTIFGKGLDTLAHRVAEKNKQIADLVRGSGKTINKAEVAAKLDQLRPSLLTQVNPVQDIRALEEARAGFATHPLLQAEEISVPLAQEMKQGTYRALGDKAWQEVGSASRESQKALARGLKEGIAKAIPEVGKLNAEESKLLNALDVSEARAIQELRNNPTGLATLASNPQAALAFMADRSSAFKSLVARMMNSAGKSMSKVNLKNVPTALAVEGEE